MYYLRTKAASAAIQFTVDKTKLRASEAAQSESSKNGKKSGEDKTDESTTTNGSGVSTWFSCCNLMSMKKVYRSLILRFVK